MSPARREDSPLRCHTSRLPGDEQPADKDRGEGGRDGPARGKVQGDLPEATRLYSQLRSATDIPQPLERAVTVLKVIQDVDYLVPRCDEHIDSEFREFLVGVGSAPRRRSRRPATDNRYARRPRPDFLQVPPVDRRNLGSSTSIGPRRPSGGAGAARVDSRRGSGRVRRHVAAEGRRRGRKRLLDETAASHRPVPSPYVAGACSGDPTDGDAFRHVEPSDGRG